MSIFIWYNKYGDDMKKGFTLIELLAVIAILGILVSLSVPLLTKFMDDATIKGMKNQENSITSAANLYIEDHCKNPLYGYICPNSYTEEYGEKYICLKDLQNDKYVESGIKRESYIGPIKYDESDCSGVIIFSQDENKKDDAYSDVKTYLACGNSDTGEYDYLTDEYFPINYYGMCFNFSVN